MEDCCTVLCCPTCATIQLHKQIHPKINIISHFNKLPRLVTG